MSGRAVQALSVCVCVYLQHIPTSGRAGKEKEQRRKGNKTLNSPLENHILLQCGTWKIFSVSAITACSCKTIKGLGMLVSTGGTWWVLQWVELRDTDPRVLGSSHGINFSYVWDCDG